MTTTPVTFNLNPDKCPPFIASLSEKLRLACTLMPEVKEKMVPILKGTVAELTSRDDVVESLKRESMPGVARAMRQVDIRDHTKENILFKTFTFWDTDNGCWCILVESADENYFEDRHETIGRG
jgi:hypothetical protein